MSGESVLVTGGSGFIGAHCIIRLLQAGFRVRTTVRSPARETSVRAMLQAGGAEPTNALSFAAADLNADAGWREAVAGCTFVLHVASPFPASAPAHDDELIMPARDGTLRVLRAARDARIARVVLTSSFAAIGYGSSVRDRSYTEEDWTELDGVASAYVKSKTLAERAAWEFIEREGGDLQLSVVNPVAVFGPVLAADSCTSIQLVKRLLDGGMPGVPRLTFGIVDVRDVADLHLRAMTSPAARGERFIGVAGRFMTIQEIGLVLKARMGALARRVPTRVLPNWLVRLAALRESALRQILPELGKMKSANSDKARRVLGWTPRSNEDAIVASAESLLRFNLLKSASAPRSGVRR